MTIDTYGVETGARQPWRELRPPDPAGVLRAAGRNVRITGDGRWYVHGHLAHVNDLYVVEGLR